LPQSRPASRFGGQLAGHKRNHSGSTVASTGPASPFTPLQSYPHIHDPESHYPSPLLDTFDLQHPNLYSKPITSTQTFSDTFYQPQYQQQPPTYHADPNLAYRAAMRRAMMQPDSDPPSLPRLPTGEFDSGFKATLDSRGQNVPKLRRTMSNVYQDELYDQAMSQPATAPLPTTRRAPVPVVASGSQSASPRGASNHEMFAQLLQAANHGHLSTGGDSPSDAPRERSPFQPTSEYAPRIQSAAKMREQQKAAADAYAYHQHQVRHSPQDEPSTISPKDAFRDASEVEGPDYSAGMMFPPMSAVSASAISTPVLSSQMENRRPMAPGQVASLQRQGSSQRSTSQQSQVSTSTPEFRPLVSMDSTHSEADEAQASAYPLLQAPSSHPSSQSSSTSDAPTPLRRPARTTADSGTYSCTYHHCSQRFETAAKLQKHKRDVHRPVSPTGTGDEDEDQVHSPRTTAALLAARNSQAGPHRCMRLNPQTGRSCNSIFSRPYDLTRHEDTIHNSRKHKVRCPFCAEEKTFSRADALTRHLRVVHPEKDVPGRRRRAH
jgi:hypothetical protein